MNRRTRWIVVGLVVVILVVLGLGWRAVRRGARKPGSAAQRERKRVADNRRRLAARQAELRARLRRLHGHGMGTYAGTSMVSGRVSSVAGKAIGAAEIRVVLPGGGVLKARSGSDGHYGLVGVPQAAERMEVWARGYQTRVFAPLRLPKSLRVRWDVTLEPAQAVHGGFVEGRVVDDRGNPVTSFSLSSSSRARRRRGKAKAMRSFRSSSGEFRLGPLAAQRLVLYAVAPGYQPQRSKPLVIHSGETVKNVVLRLARSGELVGQVTDAKTGQPISGAQVTPAAWSARTLGRATSALTDASGHFTLRSVPDSRTSLRVRASGYQPLLGGGVKCSGGQRCRRDFALTPLEAGQRAGGQLTGVGAVLRKTGDGVLIQKLLAGGPAEEVLQKGDLVVMVGDLDVNTVGLREVAQAIRGESGTDVVLWVRRPGQSEPQRVVITRARVTMPRYHR